MAFVVHIEKSIQIFEGWLRWIIDSIRNNKSIRTTKRLFICDNCKFKTSHGICHLCGCVVKAKVRVSYPLDKEGKSIDGCPMKKW